MLLNSSAAPGALTGAQTGSFNGRVRETGKEWPGEKILPDLYPALDFFWTPGLGSWELCRAQEGSCFSLHRDLCIKNLCMGSGVR